MLSRTGGGLLATSEKPHHIADGIHTLWSDPKTFYTVGAEEPVR